MPNIDQYCDSMWCAGEMHMGAIYFHRYNQRSLVPASMYAYAWCARGYIYIGKYIITPGVHGA